MGNPDAELTPEPTPDLAPDGKLEDPLQDVSLEDLSLLDLSPEATKSIITELIEQRDKARESEAELLESLQRLKAEFDNFRRRVREQQADSVALATAEMAEKLLPVLESFEAALSLLGVPLSETAGSQSSQQSSQTGNFPQTVEAPTADPVAPTANASASAVAPHTETTPTITSPTAPTPQTATTPPPPTTGPTPQTTEGILQVARLFLSVLQDQGLQVLKPFGEEFDPNLHEAAEHVPAEDNQPAGVVVDVYRTGYCWREKLIRPALVKVQG